MAKGAGNLHLKFTSDIEKASRDIDKLIVKVERLGAVAKEQKAKIAASTAPSMPMTDYGRQWGKSFGSFGMGGMTHLGGSPFGPDPRIMAGARATEQVSQRMSIFSRIMGGVNEKTIRFMGSMGVVNPQIGMMATKFGLLGAVVMGLIGVVKHVVGQIAHFGNIIEQSRIVMKSIYGSDRKAVETIRGMREFSRKTQFEPEQVVGATTMMAKYNLDPFKKGTHGLAGDKHVMDLMAGLAAMPGMGGKAIGLDRAVNAVIAGRDIRPLKALGQEAMAAYSKAKGVGMSGSPEFIKVMITELAKVPKIMALANEQADSMQGLWSTITGYAEEFWMDLTGAGEETGVVTLWSQLKDILKDVREGGERFIMYIGPYVTELGAYLGAVLKYVWGLFKLIWDIVGPVLVPAFKIIIQLFRIVWELGKGFMTTFIQLGKILVEIVSLPFKMLNAILGIKSGIEWIVSGLMKIVLGLQITFMFVQIFMEGLVKKISSVVNGIIDGIKLITSEISRAFDELVAKYENTWLGQFLKLIFSERGGAGAFGNKLNLVDPQTGKEFTPEQYKQLDEELKKQRKWEIDTTRTTGAVTGGISKTVEDFSGYSWAKEKSAARSQTREQRIIDNRSYHYNITNEPDREAIKNQTGSTKSQADRFQKGIH